MINNSCPYSVVKPYCAGFTQSSCHFCLSLMLYQNLFKGFHAVIPQVVFALSSALNLFLGYIFAEEPPWDVTGMLKMAGGEPMGIRGQTPVSCMPRFILLYVSTYRNPTIWQTLMLCVPGNVDPPRLGPLLTNDILLSSRINLSVLVIYELMQYLWQ